MTDLFLKSRRLRLWIQSTVWVTLGFLLPWTIPAAFCLAMGIILSGLQITLMLDQLVEHYLQKRSDFNHAKKLLEQYRKDYPESWKEINNEQQ